MATFGSYHRPHRTLRLFSALASAVVTFTRTLAERFHEIVNAFRALAAFAFSPLATVERIRSETPAPMARVIGLHENRQFQARAVERQPRSRGCRPIFDPINIAA